MVVASISAVLVLFGSGVFLIQMQHPDDRNAAWLPKIIVLLGLFLSCGMVLMLPFDASLSQSCDQDPSCGVLGGLATMWYGTPLLRSTARERERGGARAEARGVFRYVGFISVAIMAFVLIPLAYFWYETDDEDGVASRVATTICWCSTMPENLSRP